VKEEGGPASKGWKRWQHWVLDPYLFCRAKISEEVPKRNEINLKEK